MRKKTETDNQAPLLVDSGISKKAFHFELGPSDSKGLPYRPAAVPQVQWLHAHYILYRRRRDHQEE